MPSVAAHDNIAPVAAPIAAPVAALAVALAAALVVARAVAPLWLLPLVSSATEWTAEYGQLAFIWFLLIVNYLLWVANVDSDYVGEKIGPGSSRFGFSVQKMS